MGTLLIIGAKRILIDFKSIYIFYNNNLLELAIICAESTQDLNWSDVILSIPGNASERGDKTMFP